MRAGTTAWTQVSTLRQSDLGRGWRRYGANHTHPNHPGNEVSGTTTVFSVKDLLADAANSPSTSAKPNGSSHGSSIAAGVGIIAGLVGLGGLIGGALGFLPKTIDGFYALLPPQVRKLLP